MQFLEEYLIELINREFSGYEHMFCERLYGDMMFMPDSVRTCCFSTKMPYNPPFLFKRPIKKFNKALYLFKLYGIMKKNQTEKAVCAGCKFFKKQVVPYLYDNENITFLTINNFTKCNSGCVYCIHGKYVNKTKKEPYKIMPIIKQMYDEKMINPGCLINWGGGEPTIYLEFEELVNFFRTHYIRQAVNSSGVEFSPEVWDGLKDNSVSIQISPDAGTRETYKIVKRTDNFDRVWDNISKYTAFPDMVFIKYIFFAPTANERDVRAFIDKCVETGVKNIVIDTETLSVNNSNPTYRAIDDEIVDMAILMKHLAIEKGIKYDISYQWKEEQRRRIETE